MKTILFLILPTLISGQISIEIIPASDNKDATVLLIGNERAPVKEIDIKTFHLTENEVIENLKKIGYTWPGKINKDLNIILKPVNVRIIRNNERVEEIREKYHNTGDCDSLSYEPDANHKFEETIRTRWYEAPDISIGSNINIKTWNNRINLASAWSQDDYESKRTKLHSSDVVIPVAYMQNISSVIHATLSAIEIRVDYEAKLEGELSFGYLCNYFIKVICLQSHKLEINEYFHCLKIFRGTIKAYQIININYYRDIQFTVRDMSNETFLYSSKLQLETF